MRRPTLALLLLVAACDVSLNGTADVPIDAGADAPARRDASSAQDASRSDSAGDDDASDDDHAGSLTLTIFPRVGNPVDATPALHGPGLILMGGGTDVDGAFNWMHERVGAGDVVVLRATGANVYDAYLAALAPFNSVQTILLPRPSTRADLAAAAAIVDKAEAVFFAGDNQADYVAWKGSKLMTAVKSVHTRGGVVGGTSAGCAIHGPLVYDAVAAGTATVGSGDALANPYDARISFTRDLFAWPELGRVIADSHFAKRDRFGRLAAFMARQIADGATAAPVLGVGVDEATAVVVDAQGMGKLLQQRAGTGSAYVIEGAAAERVESGKPLKYKNLSVVRLSRAGDAYDFAKRCGTRGTVYAVDIDGESSPPETPSDPYGASGQASWCP